MRVYDTDMEVQENKNIMATASAGVWNMQLHRGGKNSQSVWKYFTSVSHDHRHRCLRSVQIIQRVLDSATARYSN